MVWENILSKWFSFWNS